MWRHNLHPMASQLCNNHALASTRTWSRQSSCLVHHVVKHCQQSRGPAFAERKTTWKSITAHHQRHQQQRHFAAWRPEWKRKARKEKMAIAKKKQLQMDQIQARLKKAQRRQAKIPLPKMEDIELPDHISDLSDEYSSSLPQGQQQQKQISKKQEVTMLSIIQAFSATSSPFLYLGCDTETAQDINEEKDPFWNHPPIYRRRTSQFEYLPPSAFDFDLPENSDIAEVAFLGRSNVGKSSLMNALMQQKLARTSKQPGRTQMVSYYGMTNTEVTAEKLGKRKNNKKHKRGGWRDCLGFLIDLPGYGFAVGPDEAVDDWQGRTQDFLLNRSETGHLRRLYLLVDSRHVNAQSTDFAVMKWLDENAPHLPYTVVLTKADGVPGGPQGLVPHLNTIALRYQQSDFQTQTEVEHAVSNNDYIPGQFQRLGQRMTNMSPLIHITSSTKKLGLQELWASVCYELAKGPYPVGDHQ